MGVEEATQNPNSTGDPQHVPEVVEQPRYDKQSWLGGATDLEEGELYVESIGTWVKVRALSVGQITRIQRKSMDKSGQADPQKIAVQTFAIGVVEPKFSEEEANVIVHRFGQAVLKVVNEINRLSGFSEEAIEAAEQRFHEAR